MNLEFFGFSFDWLQLLFVLGKERPKPMIITDIYAYLLRLSWWYRSDNDCMVFMGAEWGARQILEIPAVWYSFDVTHKWVDGSPISSTLTAQYLSASCLCCIPLTFLLWWRNGFAFKDSMLFWEKNRETEPKWYMSVRRFCSEVRKEVLAATDSLVLIVHLTKPLYKSYHQLGH